jgi:MtN3 and saliva related transmembrane protein
MHHFGPGGSVATLIGSLAAVLTTACWLPQVVKSLRLGTADDFAWPYLAMLVAGVTAWTAYGFLRSAPPIYLCNSITGLLVVVVVGVKVRSVRRRAHQAEEVAMMVIDGIES